MSKKKKITLTILVISSVIGLYVHDRICKDLDNRQKMEKFIKAAGEYASNMKGVDRH